MKEFLEIFGGTIVVIAVSFLSAPWIAAFWDGYVDWVWSLAH